MQFMQTLKTNLFSRRGIVLQFAALAVMAGLSVIASNHGTNYSLAENCVNPPVTATFNYWPVKYSDADQSLCKDFPAIDAALEGSTHVFSQSAEDLDNGLTLNA